MHFACYQNTDDKLGFSYPTLEGISPSDIINQMIIQLFVAEIQWLPALGNASLIVKHGNHFILDSVAKQFASSIFASSTMNTIHGASLPHPVDNSFIFLMAKKVAQRIEKERDAEIANKKSNADRHEQSSNYNRSFPNLVALKKRKDKDMVRYKPHEIIDISCFNTSISLFKANFLKQSIRRQFIMVMFPNMCY